MSETLEALAATCREALEGAVVDLRMARDELTLEIKREQIVSTCRMLRDHPKLAFEQLIDVCGVDYLSYGVAEEDTSGQPPLTFATGDESVPIVSADGLAPLQKRARFAVAYHLLSVKHNHRLRLRVWLDDELPRVDSVVEIWSATNWFEREAFDLYGIVFEGHPDLRRLLTDYGFIGYPFRKDFPLIGQVEMRYDEEKQRVIYQPVSIEPRVLVPRVIRDEGFGGRNP
ncbi:MAG TPA: NADH-quinone oxidoreductase subunit C [Burkholderiales bacterium]|nr:NADH-quinone oxidoreductase subunit C [Burkholderiales bacterium]